MINISGAYADEEAMELANVEAFSYTNLLRQMKDYMSSSEYKMFLKDCEEMKQRFLKSGRYSEEDFE